MPIFVGSSKLIKKTEIKEEPTLTGVSGISVKLYLSAKQPYALLTFTATSSPNFRSQLKIPLRSLSFAEKLDNVKPAKKIKVKK